MPDTCDKCGREVCPDEMLFMRLPSKPGEMTIFTCFACNRSKDVDNHSLELFGIHPFDSPGVMAEKIRAHVCESHICGQSCTDPACPWRSGGEAFAALADWQAQQKQGEGEREGANDE